MGSKLKKAAPWIAGVILVYFAYSAVDSGAAAGGPKLKDPLLRIPREVIEAKPQEGKTKFENDPFFIEWSPYGPTYDPVYIAAKKREAEEREKAEKLAEQKRMLAERAAKKRREEEEKQRRIKEAEEARKKAEAEAPGGALGFEPFWLTLESVLATSEFAVARVSGLNVEVGDTMPKLDKRKPPRVQEIRGTRVIVLHRGTRHVLDLLGTTQIAVGGVPRDAPTTSAKPSSGATRQKRKTAVSGGKRPRGRKGSLKKPPKKTAVSK